jgi:glycosyltransferase involved in cell wall biosynthesis
VKFVGHVPDISPWLARADAFLLTSNYEGYPSVLVEAIGSGVPVVSTDCSPAIREILFDPSFGRVARSDPTEMATALDAVLGRGPVNDDARQNMLFTHDVDMSANHWLAVLDRTVALRGGLVS